MTEPTSVRSFVYYPSNRKYYCQRMKRLVSFKVVVKTIDLGFPVRIRNHATKEDVTAAVVRKLVARGVVGKEQIESFINRLIEQISSKGGTV